MKAAHSPNSGLFERLKQLPWYRHGIYRDNLFTASFYLRYLGKEWFAKEGIGRGIRHMIKLNDEAFITEDEFSMISSLFYKKLHQEHFLKKYIEDYRRDNRNMLQTSERLGNKPFKQLSNKELKGSLKEFLDASTELFHWLWSMEFLTPAFDKYLKELLLKEDPGGDNRINDFFNKISYIPKRLPFQDEQSEILRIKTLNKPLLRALYKRYSWMNINFWDGRPFTYPAYEARIKKMLSARDDIRSRFEDNRNKVEMAKRCIARLNNPGLRETAKIAQELIHLKTERIDIFSISWKNILPLMDEIALRLNITYQDMHSMASEEILFHLGNPKAPIPDISSRSSYAVVRSDDNVSLHYGKVADDIRKELLKEDYSKIREVKGTIAYPGKVCGNAKVIMTDRGISKIDKGNIMVCNLTNPNYTPAFDKVAAIVTDEGGLLCHTAIMAREFKLPCVIGTKIATRVFKDGDLVEVDANRGVVRKL